ncbi:hypothetical protein N7517_009892 [Penicillium concentricum]|uniref:Uncharacterized protein n=1 Tax=Penicillium concentricum TaxID=293559 RepID=A0A9W9UZL3_9EURO|nr:uncharacterized protein N7517_009892 [Penicillium concentricum]KAJ5360701.1 hypothetical protein N7517_009892 [Penicillium concentricum]
MRDCISYDHPDGPQESEIFARAIVRGDLEAVKDHLCAAVDPNSYIIAARYMLTDPSKGELSSDLQPWLESIRSSNTALILAFASGVNDTKLEGFAFALGYCTLETMQAFIDAGIDLNKTSLLGNTVAHAIALQNSQEIFDLVAPHLTPETMTSISSFYRMPLHMALKQRSPNLVMRFIDAGADINPLDRRMDIALWTALKQEHFRIARLILGKYANSPLQAYIGGRELLAATSTEKYDIIQTLMDRGVSKEQDERDEVTPLVGAVRTRRLGIVKLAYERGPTRPFLRHNPGKLYSPSAYAGALGTGSRSRAVLDYLDGIIDNEFSDPQTLPRAESDTHADMARKIMEAMSDLLHWGECFFWDECFFGDSFGVRFDLINQIALHILPLAGADLNSVRICELVEKARNIFPDKQAMPSKKQKLTEALKVFPRDECEISLWTQRPLYGMNVMLHSANGKMKDKLIQLTCGISAAGEALPDTGDELIERISDRLGPGPYRTMWAVVQAIKYLESTEKAEEGGWTGSYESCQLEKAILRLLRTVREESDPERRALFLETLEAVIQHHITDRLDMENNAELDRAGTIYKVPPGVEERSRKLTETLHLFYQLARENIDDKQMDRLMLVISRLLRF